MRRDEDAEARGRLVRFVPQVFPPLPARPPALLGPLSERSQTLSTGREARRIGFSRRPFLPVRSGQKAGYARYDLERGEELMRVSHSALRPTFTWPEHPSPQLPRSDADKPRPGRPAAKERPPPDQSGVAADCATRTHENDPGATSRWHPSNEGTGGPSRLVSGTARPIPMLGSSGELGPSLMAAAANRPPGASVLPRDSRRHWSPEQFRLRRPASRATYPTLRGHVGA